MGWLGIKKVKNARERHRDLSLQRVPETGLVVREIYKPRQEVSAG